jgi:hypothetical protein
MFVTYMQYIPTPLSFVIIISSYQYSHLFVFMFSLTDVAVFK